MEQGNYVIKITFTYFWNVAKLYLSFFVNPNFFFLNVFLSADFTIMGQAGSFQSATFNAYGFLRSFKAQINS